jgi:hypothetical protein
VGDLAHLDISTQPCLLEQFDRLIAVEGTGTVRRPCATAGAPYCSTRPWRMAKRPSPSRRSCHKLGRSMGQASHHVTTASFAIGVAAISRHRRFTRNFEAALFGNVLGITPADLWMIAGVTLAAAFGIFPCTGPPL